MSGIRQDASFEAEPSVHDDQDTQTAMDYANAAEAMGLEDDADEAKRKQRLDALTWKPPTGVAVMTQQLELSHPMVRRNWNVTFVRVQTSLHMLQGILPTQPGSEEFAQLDEVINARLRDLTEKLTTERSRLEHLATAEGISIPSSKVYTEGDSLSVPAYTPGSVRYLRLVQRIDDMLWIVDYLWLNGVLSVKHKNELTNAWRKHMWDFVGFVTSTWQRARKPLQERQAARNQVRTARASEEQGQGQPKTAPKADKEAKQKPVRPGRGKAKGADAS